MRYTRAEAKEWARQEMRGVCNVLMPSFTSDFTALNEVAIRHDVRRAKELGFWGSLVVSECGTTVEEYLHFMEVAADEAGPDFHLVVQASFETLEHSIRVCKAAESIGATLVLPSYPVSFYPRSAEDIYDYTRAVLDGTDLATVLFPVHQWGFGRLHPSDITPDTIARLAKEPTAVAVKAEGGPPGNGAIAEILRLCGDDVLISDPREWNSPGWVQWFGMQWMGTSNFECYGSAVPTYFAALQEGRWDDAMELYWKIHPVRQARLKDMASFAGAGTIHRLSWKYQSWLNGFNGGALRMPSMRLQPGQTSSLANAMISAGTIPADTETDVGQFFIGRNPQ
jgi:dihydrodipicolinate synthase/N-acetylneuraminate lyase